MKSLKENRHNQPSPKKPISLVSQRLEAARDVAQRFLESCLRELLCFINYSIVDRSIGDMALTRDHLVLKTNRFRILGASSEYSETDVVVRRGAS